MYRRGIGRVFASNVVQPPPMAFWSGSRAFFHSLAERCSSGPGRKAVAPAPACGQRIGQMRFYKNFRGVE